VFGQSLVKEAQKDDKIVGITAAMPSAPASTFSQSPSPSAPSTSALPNSTPVTFAAGLATEGYKPFCAIYSTFLQRGYDQIVHDVAIQGLPVRFAIDRAGLVGADGATHAGSFDNAYLGCLPGFVIMAASDEAELVHMVANAGRDQRPPQRVALSARRRPRRRDAEFGVPFEIARAASSGKATRWRCCRLAPVLPNARRPRMNWPRMVFPPPSPTPAS